MRGGAGRRSGDHGERRQRRPAGRRAQDRRDERIRNLAEHATELIVEIDPASGRMLYASPSASELLGYAPDELCALGPLDLVHPDDRAATQQEFAHAIATEGTACSEHRARHRDGSWRWFADAGPVFCTESGELRLVVIGREITGRKRAEQALERQLAVEQRIAGLSRRLLGLAASDIAAGIREALAEAADLAAADRAYLLWFERGCPQAFRVYDWRLPGVPAAAPRARPWPWATAHVLAGETLHVPRVADLPPEAAAERADLEAHGVKSLLGIPVRWGSELLGFLGLEARRAPRCWSDQEITLLRMLGELFTSALRRARTETALRESQAQLLHAQKLEAVGRLAGGVAHEFNNLLSVILGFSRPLLRELAPGDPARDDVAEIHAAAERAAALIRQLLAVGRRHPAERRAVDLNAVLDGIAGMLDRLLGEDVELAIERAPALASVYGDPRHLEQLCFNLAANARDAMPDGGRFSIETHDREVDARERLRLGLPREGRYAVIVASDSGLGMDERTRSRIFEPFYTTKEPGKGTGLGLSIVYTIVEQCGGAIRVDAEPGKGSCFEIYLPSERDGDAPELAAGGPSASPGV